jgi:glutamate---cysteine ligase / carboxylate-amine ligase
MLTIPPLTDTPVAPAARSPRRPDSPALPTVGVEEEFLVLDPATGLPVQAAEEVLALAQGDGCASTLQPEVLRSQVETASPVCQTLGEVSEHLSHSRRALGTAARRLGTVVAPVGAAPVGEPSASITPKDRYLTMAKAAPALMQEQLINGMHVHVEVPSRAAGIAVMNRLRPSLHVLLALSANSPWWRGTDSGFASWRAVHGQRWPVDGAPPYCRDEQDHERRVQALLDMGVIMDRAQLYWQLRVSERYPTVEVRIADVAIDVRTATTYTGLVRALVVRALRDHAAGVPTPQPTPELLRAATWQAARAGLGGELAEFDDLASGLPRVRPATDVVLGLAERAGEVLPTAERTQVLEGVEAILASGGGAQRQRWAVTTGGIPALVRLFGRSMGVEPPTGGCGREGAGTGPRAGAKAREVR